MYAQYPGLSDKFSLQHGVLGCCRTNKPCILLLSKRNMLWCCVRIRVEGGGRSVSGLGFRVEAEACGFRV